jgi:hypothetical protein
MEDLKPIKHTLIERGLAALIIDKGPNWIIPSACLSVAFYADPKEVLKYGSNGLHFAEHILWNMTAKESLYQSNASTFSTGEMAVYGLCEERDLSSSMTSFFEGLIDMAKCKLSKKMKSVFVIEQRRVTCETERMQEESAFQKEENEKMFIFNTDMIRSQYSPDYIWKILLEECKIGKVIVMAHCRVSDADIHLFEDLAGKFNAAWDERKKFSPKTVLLPTYYAPPFSMLSGIRSSRSSPPHTVVFDDSVNPIERTIISLEVSHETRSYPFAVDINRPVPRLPTPRSKNLKYVFLFDDPYFAVPILAAYSGSLKEEWIDDLYTKAPGALVKKYSASAVEKMAAIERSEARRP